MYGRRWRLVVLAAREAGLSLLRGLPRVFGGVEFRAIYTHRRLPRSEDPARGERPEFAEFAELARAMGVPLTAVDTREEARRLTGLDRCRPFDVLLSVSWRYRVPSAVLGWPRVAPINLHRGRLPDYAGAEPVRRALMAGERSITLTAHIMTDEIDAGPVLVEGHHPVRGRCGPAPADDVERIKGELLPLYAGLAAEAMARAVNGAVLRA